MKKIALTSLLAVFAAAGANAANVIDGNPLYMPKAGHFYSETAVDSHSEHTDSWMVTEEFGYGVTDKLAVSLSTDLFEEDGFDIYGWGHLGLNATFRALDRGAWKVDAFAGYSAGTKIGESALVVHVEDADDTFWFDKEFINYMWTVGVRGGYTTSLWTVAGHASFNYAGSESFNWGDEGLHIWTLGVDGQFVIDSNWNLVAGVEYTGLTDDGGENEGTWEGKFGVNYNIDATKYLGAYVSAELNHHEGDAHDSWGFSDGFGFGVKFGIDF